MTVWREADWRKRPELDGTSNGKGVHSDAASLQGDGERCLRRAQPVTATHGDAGVIWARETGPATRIRLKLVDGFLDLREEVLDGGQWRWTHCGLQIEVSRGADLARALEGACSL